MLPEIPETRVPVVRVAVSLDEDIMGECVLPCGEAWKTWRGVWGNATTKEDEHAT